MAKAKEVVTPVPELKDPFGTPDKGGKFFYQRFWRLVHTLPESDQQALHSIMDLTEAKQNTFLTLMRMWQSAQQFDRDDYHAVSGRG